MQKDYFEQKREKIAASLIKRYKANESKILAEYGSRAAYFLEAMAAELWKDAKIRDEFQGNQENLKQFLENENRVSMHRSKHKRYTKADAPADDSNVADAGLKIKWDADAALRAEFDNNFGNYKSWRQNQHRVRNFA
jgi:hypothetical protein